MGWQQLYKLTDNIKDIYGTYQRLSSFAHAGGYLGTAPAWP